MVWGLSPKSQAGVHKTVSWLNFSPCSFRYPAQSSGSPIVKIFTKSPSCYKDAIVNWWEVQYLPIVFHQLFSYFQVCKSCTFSKIRKRAGGWLMGFWASNWSISLDRSGWICTFEPKYFDDQTGVCEDEEQADAGDVSSPVLGEAWVPWSPPVPLTQCTGWSAVWPNALCFNPLFGPMHCDTMQCKCVCIAGHLRSPSDWHSEYTQCR